MNKMVHTMVGVLIRCINILKKMLPPALQYMLYSLICYIAYRMDGWISKKKFTFILNSSIKDQIRSVSDLCLRESDTGLRF